LRAHKINQPSGVKKGHSIKVIKQELQVRTALKALKLKNNPIPGCFFIEEWQ
jgi:hypothetical protein